MALKLNELFSGIGAFRKALINLKIPHEIVGISEIDKYAIASYEAIYGQTRNYGDISKVERLDYADLWTYGFPCQDISLAGRMDGIVKGQTRSGLLYEVQRLLAVAETEGNLPKYLIMENVKNLTSSKFMTDFQGWLDWLESIGYENYWKVLNSKDFGIPQHRERVFVVSIRKDLKQSFVFPEPNQLTPPMKDFLEDEVDEKYYLSDAYLKYATELTVEQTEIGNGFKFTPIERESAEISKTITPKVDRVTSNFIIETPPPDTSHLTSKTGTSEKTGASEQSCVTDQVRNTTTGLSKSYPLNPMDDGSCRTIKAQYGQTSFANFKHEGTFGATGVISIRKE